MSLPFLIIIIAELHFCNVRMPEAKIYHEYMLILSDFFCRIHFGFANICAVYDLTSVHIIANNNSRFEFNVIVKRKIEHVKN